MITHILLDIEGTTCPTKFVSDILFPYAKTHLSAFITASKDQPECTRILQNAWQEWRADQSHDSQKLLQSASEGPSNDPLNLIPYLEHLIETDQKSPPLKELQGLIWDHGYANGDLTAELFPEVWDCLNTWKRRGLTLSVYSSGSIHAQKLLYSHTSQGDCSAEFTHWFDTSTGPKKETSSYQSIRDVLGVAAEKILFISDSKEECDAAAMSGMKTLFSLREGNPCMTPGHHTVITNLNQVMDIALDTPRS